MRKENYQENIFEEYGFDIDMIGMKRISHQEEDGVLHIEKMVYMV